MDVATDELDAFFASYREAYTDLDLDAVVEHYTVPLLSVTPDDLFWLTSETDVRKVMGAYLDTLDEAAYDRGEIDRLVYHPLSDQDVLASSAWTRYTTAGEVMERLGTPTSSGTPTTAGGSSRSCCTIPTP
ncbi:MAG: hypothetical protein ABEJ74_05730 [Haloferacaceae archaeon]